MNKIIQGDCIEVLKTLEDNSVDSIVTDPPYGLEFMGKDWDKFKDAKNIAGGTKKGTPFDRQEYKTMPSFYQMSKKNVITNPQGSFEHKKGFKQMVRYAQGETDLKTFQHFTTDWATECLRVLKPGGFLLSFGGTRTYHRMACGIEDAGFEIRDCIGWVYGSGFPKSLNVGKAVDKLQGNEREEYTDKSFLKRNPNDNTTGIMEKGMRGGIEGSTKSKGSSPYEGWGTALKPAWENICVARKPLSEKNVALNVLKWGTGGINIDECRIEFEDTKNPATNPLYRDKNNYRKPSDSGQKTGEIIKFTNSLNPPSNLGRFPANIIFECICDELKEGKETISGGFGAMDIGISDTGKGVTQEYNPKLSQKKEGIYNIHTNPNCPCYMLDEQTEGKVGNGHWAKTKVTGFGEFGNGKSEYFGVGEKDKSKAGASRFFYCAKSSKSERNNGLEGFEEVREADRIKDDGIGGDNPRNRSNNLKKNHHPTVKPISLMAYLCRLVTPKGGIVLDPFMGSGSTGIGALKEGFSFIGIEKEEEYVKIAKARIKPYLEQEKLEI